VGASHAKPSVLSVDKKWVVGVSPRQVIFGKNATGILFGRGLCRGHPKKFLTTKGTKKHELFLELGGVQIVTFRNSIANSCLFSPANLTNLHSASCTWDIRT
jgi:hypothetical protein